MNWVCFRGLKFPTVFILGSCSFSPELRGKHPLTVENRSIQPNREGYFPSRLPLILQTKMHATTEYWPFLVAAPFEALDFSQRFHEITDFTFVLLQVLSF